MMKKQYGFTIVELIVVIIILTILAVVAFPRFVDIQQDAQISKNTAIASAFEQGVKSAQLLWQVDGKPSNTNNNNRRGPQVNYNGNLVTVDANTGFPVGSAGRDTGVHINASADCLTIFTDIMDTSITIVDRVNRNNPSTTNRANFDVLVTRTNDNSAGDKCNYYLIETIPSDSRNPGDGIPNQYLGFSYNAQTGAVDTFNFL